MTQQINNKDIVEQKLREIDMTGNINVLLSEDMQKNTIPIFVREWIRDKPWAHMYEPILMCARYSPQALKLILKDRLEGGGKITFSVFGKKPDQITHYFDVYPLDILLYCLRTDMMIFDDLMPKTEDVFFNKIARMPEFKRFALAVKEFVE